MRTAGPWPYACQLLIFVVMQQMRPDGILAVVAYIASSCSITAVNSVRKLTAAAKNAKLGACCINQPKASASARTPVEELTAAVPVPKHSIYLVHPKPRELCTWLRTWASWHS